MPSRIKQSKYGYDVAFRNDIRRNVSANSGVNRVIDGIFSRLLDYNTPLTSGDFGYDIDGAIRFSQPAEYDSIAIEIEEELKKDDRIASINVIIEQPDADGNVRVSITGTTSEESSFDLIGGVNMFSAEEFTFV